MKSYSNYIQLSAGRAAAAVCRDKKVMNHLTQPSSHVFFFSGEKGQRKEVPETRPVLCGPQEEVG